ncbi:hypothetical protein TNCV_556681 [Trichonephila clavipes]|uniref:Uncharacterized protein n=1 Tax=Trichonephila clavipes TaxID=2585209 RepID=A0A8X6RLM3_TRICX|nr:hypothetical protein TNCV_556681 [Trichonephila clavipes]
MHRGTLTSRRAPSPVVLPKSSEVGRRGIEHRHVEGLMQTTTVQTRSSCIGRELKFGKQGSNSCIVIVT